MFLICFFLLFVVSLFFLLLFVFCFYLFVMLFFVVLFVVLSLYSEQLLQSEKPHITQFATESFGFLLRKVFPSPSTPLSPPLFSVLHTENAARGANSEFPKCRGGEGVYNVLTFQKSRGGAKVHLGGAKAPCPPQ